MHARKHTSKITSSHHDKTILVQRERESALARAREREREERSVCVCVCVREREREMHLALQHTDAGDKFSNIVGPRGVSMIDNEYNNIFVCVFSFVMEVANAAKKHVPEALENLVLFFIRKIYRTHTHTHIHITW